MCSPLLSICRFLSSFFPFKNFILPVAFECNIDVGSACALPVILPRQRWFRQWQFAVCSCAICAFRLLISQQSLLSVRTEGWMISGSENKEARRGFWMSKLMRFDAICQMQTKTLAVVDTFYTCFMCFIFSCFCRQIHIYGLGKEYKMHYLKYHQVLIWTRCTGKRVDMG